MRWLEVLSPAAVAAPPPALAAHQPSLASGEAEPVLASPLGADPSSVPAEKRVYLEVFGCQMNKLDGELMIDVLLGEGYAVTNDISDAGVILFNTCAVREQAENRVFSKLGQLRGLKNRRPDVVIGVAGCSAQNHQRDILARFPHVGIVCGPGEFLRLPELVLEARRRGQVAALDLARPVTFTRTRNLGPNPHQAFVSVMRGCDMACTFCIVPRTRGPELSRPVREIADECRALVDGGVREITLLGQTVNSYGKRLGPGRSIGLQHVLHELNKIPSLERIRFITSHPRFMSEDLIDAMGNLEKVCEYLHLPVQSGSDAVLRRMQRSYTMKHYRKVIESCRARISGLALATDIIVGFSGETDAEFAETYRLLEEIRFHGAFIFRYSERPGTAAAASLEDGVPESVKRERNQALLALQQRIGLDWLRQAVGATREVLVESLSKRDKRRWTGRSRAHEIVVFPADEGEDLRGKLVDVRITEATSLVLVGERASAGR